MPRRAYEAQQAELQNEPERSLGASYCGPGLMIENGEVVWRRVVTSFLFELPEFEEAAGASCSDKFSSL